MMKMKLRLNIVLPVLAMLLLSSFAAAMLIPANDKARENAKAPGHSPVIEETPAGEWDLERFDFIHYAKPVSPSKPGTDTCYKLMGVKWAALPVSYAVNPSNSQGLSEEFVLGTLSASSEAWDAATSSELLNAPSVDYTAQYGVQDYQNAVAFGDYSDSNVIGVTTVWYTRVGKRIVEFDMLFNTRFQWGDASLNPALMDLQNIATHEFGHSVGMSDIYSASCTAVTMYGYSNNCDIAKRTLEQPDAAGLQKMYGL